MGAVLKQPFFCELTQQGSPKILSLWLLDFREVLIVLTNTTGYARGSKKLLAMSRKKKPPMIE